MASNQAAPSAIAVSASHVYWTNEGEGVVVEAQTEGTAVKTFAKAPGATALALDDTSVYWGGDAIGKAALDGGAAADIGIANGTVQKIAVQGQKVYWLDAGGLQRVGTDGSDQETVEPWADGYSFALMPGYAYWTQYGSHGFLYRTPLDGSLREYLAVAEFAYDFTVSSGTLYWSENYLQASVYGLVDNQQTSLARAYGATRVTSDDGSLYWIEAKVAQTYSIQRVSLPDGASDRQSVVLLDSMATDLAVDDKYLYWTDRSAGTVKRSPKVPAP